MYKRFCFLLIVSCLAFFGQAKAQINDPKTIEVGPHVGVSYYMGDLNPLYPFLQSRLEYGGVVRFNYNYRWSFRYDYAHAKVTSDDLVTNWRPERGLNFTSNINDFSLEAEFNFLEYYTGNPRKNVSPYIFGGISVFLYNVYTKVGDDMVNLKDYDTEGPEPIDIKWYEKMVAKSFPVGFSIPFGFGVKFALSKHLAGTVEWRMQKTFTDYLDDVAKEYPETHALYVTEDASTTYDLTDPTGNYLAGQQRGNSAYKDWFGMARASLTWKFNMPDRKGCNLSKF